MEAISRLMMAPPGYATQKLAILGTTSHSYTCRNEIAANNNENIVRG